MIQSMTGFGTASSTLQGDKGEVLNLTIEIKTLNSRFFELITRLPSSLHPLEHTISSALKKKLFRGKVFLSVRIGGEHATLDHVIPCLPLAQEYTVAAKVLKEATGLSGELSIVDLMNFPNIFSFEKGTLTEEQGKEVLSTIEQATDLVVVNRVREGETLLVDLEERFEQCRQKMLEVVEHTKNNLTLHKEKIDGALELANQGDEQAKIKLEELYRLFDKIDVHEEITRFNSHLNAIVGVLENNTPVKGRRLDFIVQELARETNTVTAKCSNFSISSTAVDIKVELEKAREQIQNIV